MRDPPVDVAPGMRDVIGAWIVCLAITAGCFGLLPNTGAGYDNRPEALIGSDPIATVALADAHRVKAHRPGRC